MAEELGIADFTATRNAVALLECRSYDSGLLKEKIDQLCRSLSFRVNSGSKVILKPNLVTAKSAQGLAWTNPLFVRGVAEWFVDHGAELWIGDSPAFGSGRQVMAACGIAAALKGLPVKALEFKKVINVELACGLPAGIAAEVFEADLLINLPKIKAHNQMLLTLAVKNLFGCVVGCRKALAHMRYGEKGTLFFEMLVDLLAVLPKGLSIIDGVVAMHGEGPVSGTACELGLVGASRDPVALDTAVMAAILVDSRLSPLWRECRKRKMPGANLDRLVYVLEEPAALQNTGFLVPLDLDPVRFCMGRFCRSAVKRLLKYLR